MTDFLENLGYRVGLTYTVVPYDWRFSMKKSNTTKLIHDQIKYLYEMTSKKVSIISHSYGNLRTLRALNTMNPDLKDTYISKFISVAAPFMGSYSLLKYVL